jgi:GNAT superfamily N-acetyltransferase
MTQLSRLRSIGQAPTARDRGAAELHVIADRRRSPSPGEVTDRPVVRARTAADREALVEMVRRCSPETLRRRFHAPTAHLSTDRVVDLLDRGPAVVQRVAEVGGHLVAVGTLHRLHSGEGEVAVLVEDAWQATGLGRRMMGHLLRGAVDVGVTVVVADVLRQPGFLVESLRRVTPDTRVSYDGPVATVHIPLGPAAA